MQELLLSTVICPSCKMVDTAKLDYEDTPYEKVIVRDKFETDHVWLECRHCGFKLEGSVVPRYGDVPREQFWKAHNDAWDDLVWLWDLLAFNELAEQVGFYMALLIGNNVLELITYSDKQNNRIPLDAVFALSHEVSGGEPVRKSGMISVNL